MQLHRVSAAEFEAVATVRGGAVVVPTLRAAQLSKRLLLLRAVADAATERHPGLYRSSGAADSMSLLATAHEVAPAPVTETLRHPFLDSWATECLRGLLAERTPPGLGDALAHLGGYAAVAAASAGLDATVRLPAGRTAALPGLGRLLGTGTPAAVSASTRSGELRVRLGDAVATTVPPAADAPGWEPVRRVRVSAAGRHAYVVVDDVDPYRDRFGAAVTDRLTEDRYARLANQLAAAWRLLVADHPDVADEVGAAPLTLVPLRRPDGGEASGASRHAFGAIGSSLPAEPEFFAELIVHELAHVRLGGLLDIVPLYDDSGAARLHAPWRDDPRPLGALLQGAYAHLAVAAFWRVQRHRAGALRRDAADERFALLREQSAVAIRTLGTAPELTPAGERFVRLMAATSTDLDTDRVDDRLVGGVRRSLRLHRQRWQREHGATTKAGTG